jgi:hypothetical protein
MCGMDEKRIEIEANLALHQMFSYTDKAEAIYVIEVMHNTCYALDRGDDGARAVKALLNLWRRLNLNDINGASISDLCAVVYAMYRKSNEGDVHF